MAVEQLARLKAVFRKEGVAEAGLDGVDGSRCLARCNHDGERFCELRITRIDGLIVSTRVFVPFESRRGSRTSDTADLRLASMLAEAPLPWAAAFLMAAKACAVSTSAIFASST